MIRNTFAAFILSHGRPDKVHTYNSLKKSGYTGKTYVIVDNEDASLPKYQEKYGDEVIVFDKKEIAKSVDACDNIDRRDSVVYARNYCFQLARQLGLTHHLQLDDDYTWLGWSSDSHRNFITSNVFTVKIDKIFETFIDFLDLSGAASVAFSQTGDFIGGAHGAYGQHIKNNTFTRKAMNAFFFRTEANVIFRGRVNDDVNLYVERGRMGELFITVPRFRLNQPNTQAEIGGCTDVYKAMGTYVKSFYSVMVAPSCVSVAMMGSKHRRVHHRVSWANACPKIIDEKYRKNR